MSNLTDLLVQLVPRDELLQSIEKVDSMSDAAKREQVLNTCGRYENIANVVRELYKTMLQANFDRITEVGPGIEAKVLIHNVDSDLFESIRFNAKITLFYEGTQIDVFECHQSTHLRHGFEKICQIVLTTPTKAVGAALFTSRLITKMLSISKDKSKLFQTLSNLNATRIKEFEFLFLQAHFEEELGDASLSQEDFQKLCTSWGQNSSKSRRPTTLFKDIDFHIVGYNNSVATSESAYAMKKVDGKFVRCTNEEKELAFARFALSQQLQK